MKPERQGEILQEEGIVLSVTPATAGGPATARIMLQAGDHCDGCPACAVCRPGQQGGRLLEVVDPVGVGVGDRVRVTIRGTEILRASLLLYGLPLLLLVLGVGAGQRLWSAAHALRDLWSFLLGVGLAGAALPLVRYLSRRDGAVGRELMQPVITHVVSRGTGGRT